MICGPIAIKNLVKLISNKDLELNELIKLTNCEKNNGTSLEDFITICKKNSIQLKKSDKRHVNTFPHVSIIRSFKEKRMQYHVIVVLNIAQHMDNYGATNVYYTDCEAGNVFKMTDFQYYTTLVDIYIPSLITQKDYNKCLKLNFLQNQSILTSSSQILQDFRLRLKKRFGQLQNIITKQ